MADEKKKPDEKHEDKPLPPAPEATITITLSAIQQLIKAGIAEAVGKPPDDRMKDEIDRIRGRNVPPPPEDLIPCVSPITGSSFTVRVIRSRGLPQGRIIELLDYVHPEGWDLHKEHGGTFDGAREVMNADGRPKINPE